jgi:hypothetical protein
MRTLESPRRQPSFVQEAIAELGGLMGDANHDARLVEGQPDEGVDQFPCLHIEPALRLVEKQQLWFGHQEPGDFGTSAHPKTRVSHPTICGIFQSNHFEGT